MKNFKFLAVIAVAIMSVFTFSSCSDDDDKTVSIVGTWDNTRTYTSGTTETTTSTTLVFNSDHTGVIKESITTSESRATNYKEMKFNWSTTVDSAGDELMKLSYVSGDKDLTFLEYDPKTDKNVVLWNREYALTGNILNIYSRYHEGVWVFNRK